MSDWDVDSIADNAWSSLDEVAWIECEGRGDHIVPDPRTPRGTSFLSVDCHPKAAGECTRGVRKISDQICQRLWRLDHTDANIKGQTFTDFEGEESGYNVKERVSSPSKGVWCGHSPGSSAAVLSLSRASSRSDSVIKSGPEIEPKEETSRYSFEGGIGMCKGESGYHEGGSDIINSSCHFLLSDICPPGGDLEFLAESHEEGRRDNLLEYGWGNTNNLEDMDKLFLSTDSMLSRGFDNNDDGMLWEPPSPTLGDSLENMHQPVPASVCQRFVSTGVAKCFEAHSELSASKNTASYSNDEIGSGEEWSVPRADISVDPENSCLRVQIDNHTDYRKGNSWQTPEASEGGSRDSANMEDEASHIPQETDKAHEGMRFGPSPSEENTTQAFEDGEKCKSSKARRHRPRSKRQEENSRKLLSQRKLALGVVQAKKSPILYVPVVPIAQDTPPCSTPMSQVTRGSSSEPISPMQCLQPVPYVHAGFGFPAHHHQLPVVIPSPVMPQQLQLQGQPVFIGYQPPCIDASKFQRSKTTFDVPSQSPTASSTMTPQEKIEKLRWRQKMQARLAVEQQQQKLINQRLIPDQAQCGKQHTHYQLNSSEDDLGGPVRFAHPQSAEPLTWNERSVSLEGTIIEDGDEFLATTVLHQLLNIASKMDTRTRLCLRDGFHRLAGNAMQRRAAGDTRGNHKRNSEPANSPRMAESSSSSEQSCSQRFLTVDDIVETETNPMDRFIAHLLFHKRFDPSLCSVSENSESHQNAWAWQETNPSSEHATRSSSVLTGDFGSSVVVNKALDIAASDTICDKPMDTSAFSSIVSGLQLQKVLNFSAAPVDTTPLQHLEERERTDMAGMDTVLTAVATASSNSFGDVEELTA